MLQLWNTTQTWQNQSAIPLPAKADCFAAPPFRLLVRIVNMWRREQTTRADPKTAVTGPPRERQSVPTQCIADGAMTYRTLCAIRCFQ